MISVGSAVGLGGGGPRLLGLVVVAVLAGLVVLLVAAAVGGREADPGRRRNEAVYLAVTSFVALYLALFASLGTVASVVSLIGPNRPAAVQVLVPNGLLPQGLAGSGPAATTITSGGPAVLPGGRIGPGARVGAITVRSVPRRDRVTSGAVGSGLIALAALGVFGLLRGRLYRLLADERARAGPAGGALSTYRHAVAFISIFVTALAGASFLYGIYRIIAPGISMSGGRSAGVRELIDSGYLMGMAAWIFLSHRRPSESLPWGIEITAVL